MRRIIMLMPNEQKLSEGDVTAQIEEIVTLLDGYLEEYPVKNARSKHALMGPVAKVLDRAKAGKWAAEPLTGYALRMHEMNPRIYGGYISPTAVENLRRGIEKLLLLCQTIPITALATTVEQIDYSLFFQRRKKGLEWLEGQGQNLRQFLQEKYDDDAAFRKAWALKRSDTVTLDTIRYFGSSNKRYRDGNESLKADMDEFYQKMREQNQNPDAGEEEEEM